MNNGTSLNNKIDDLQQQREQLLAQIAAREKEYTRLSQLEAHLAAPQTKQSTVTVLKELIGPFDEEVLGLLRKKIRKQRPFTPNPSSGPQPLTDVPVSTSAGGARLRAMRTEEPFELNIMVVGASGLGKCSLVSALLAESAPGLYAMLKKAAFGKYTVADIKLDQFVLRLRSCIMRVDDEQSAETAINFVRQQHQTKYENDLSAVLDIGGPKAMDTRVHACLYLMAPSASPAQMTLQFQTMAQLSLICNVIPLIARVDSMSADELEGRRPAMRRALEDHGVLVYGNAIDQNKIPLAVASGTNGTLLRGGIHADMATDLPILRCVLFESHTANLKSLTHTASYSRFRLAKRDALQEHERKKFASTA